MNNEACGECNSGFCDKCYYEANHIYRVTRYTKFKPICGYTLKETVLLLGFWLSVVGGSILYYFA